MTENKDKKIVVDSKDPKLVIAVSTGGTTNPPPAAYTF